MADPTTVRESVAVGDRRAGPAALARVRRIAGTALRYAVLLAVTAVIVVPVVYAVLSGFRDAPQLAANPVGLPDPWVWTNYTDSLTKPTFWVQLRNSAVVAGLSTIVVVLLFSFVWNWNEDYVTKFLVGDGIKLFTNQLGKFDSLFPTRTTGMTHPAEGGEIQLVESFKMAATVVSIIPLLLLYFVGQKSFVQGIEKTGITGE